MAEATTLEAPTAAPAAPAAAPPDPKPSNSPPIEVTPAVVDKGPQAPPPKPGSARDKMFQDLRKKAGEEPTATTPETTPETTPAEGSPTEGAPATTPVDEKGKKVSPWKLVDQYKKRATELEQEVAKAKTSSLAEKEKAEYTTKLQALEQKLSAFEEEQRHTNYQKSDEFKTKYQKPYEDAWGKAMNELSELTVSDPATGQDRPMNANDMLELVNLDLREARAQAVEKYGDFADDVMAHRKEIKSLFNQQSAALEEARKNGAQWEQERTQKMTQAQQQAATQIKQMWDQFNEAATKDEKYGQYFKPVEGDAEGNSRLEKGYALADKAFSQSPLDPRLTPEQRAEVVKVHAAVRNRAAAFGRTLYQLNKATAEIAELKKQLGQFKATVPGAGEGGPEGSQTPKSARDEVFGALSKYVH